MLDAPKTTVDRVRETCRSLGEDRNAGSSIIGLDPLALIAVLVEEVKSQRTEAGCGSTDLDKTKKLRARILHKIGE